MPVRLVRLGSCAKSCSGHANKGKAPCSSRLDRSSTSASNPPNHGRLERTTPEGYAAASSWVRRQERAQGCKPLPGGPRGIFLERGHSSRPQECERAKTPSQTDVHNAPRALLASPEHPIPPVSLQTSRCARARPQTPA